MGFHAIQLAAASPQGFSYVPEGLSSTKASHAPLPWVLRPTLLCRLPRVILLILHLFIPSTTHITRFGAQLRELDETVLTRSDSQVSRLSGRKRLEGVYGVNPWSNKGGTHKYPSSPHLCKTRPSKVELTRLLPCDQVGSWRWGRCHRVKRK